MHLASWLSLLDSGGERNTGKENGLHQATDRGITFSSLLPSQDMQSKSAAHESRSSPFHLM